MSRRSSHAPGAFSWADLVTPDLEAAKELYSALFGWEYTDHDAGGGAIHARATLGGDAVAGLNQMPEKGIARGLSAFWLSIVTVASAEETAARARALGGALRAEMDVDGWGRRAAVVDPTDAQLAIWEPREWIGAERVNDPGCLVWHELASADPGAAIAFYSVLFGWRFEPIETPGGLGYCSIEHEGVAEGRHGHMRELTDIEEEHELPSRWMPYFTVASADAAVELIEGSGGVAMPAGDLPAVGRISTLYDPQGAYLGVFENNADDDREPAGIT